jgi:hypothetical protein
MIPIGWNNDQYFEALPIDDMREGHEKKLAIKAFEKKHGIEWPKVLFRRNLLVQEVMESGADWKFVVMNGRTSSAKPPY